MQDVGHDDFLKETLLQCIAESFSSQLVCAQKENAYLISHSK